MRQLHNNIKYYSNNARVKDEVNENLYRPTHFSVFFA